jgi:hypothetical protein
MSISMGRSFPGAELYAFLGRRHDLLEGWIERVVAARTGAISRDDTARGYGKKLGGATCIAVELFTERADLLGDFEGKPKVVEPTNSRPCAAQHEL